MSAPAGGLYRPLVWSLSVLLLGLGGLLAIHMIAASLGPFRFGDLGTRDPRARVGVWVGARAGDRALAARWRTWLPGPAGVETLASLETVDAARLGVLVLPEPRELDTEQTRALVRFVAAGGGVVLTGSVGVRDAAGRWQGYGHMQTLLGVEAVRQVEAEQAGALVAAQRGPLSAPLAPAAALAVAPEPGLPALAAPEAELRWAPAAAGGAPGPAASLRRTLGAGRIAWIAAGPERAAGDPRPHAAVLDAAVAGVARRPLHELLAWPDGRPFAAVIEAAGAPSADAAALRARLAREIGAARAAGDLARLRVPPEGAAARPPLARQGGAVGAPRGPLAPVLAELERHGAWVGSAAELSAWTRRRASLEARLRVAGPQRLVVEVTNHARTPAGGAVLRLHLNQPALGVRAEPTALGQARPIVRFRPGDEWLDLALPELAARRSAAFHVDYEPVPPG